MSGLPAASGPNRRLVAAVMTVFAAVAVITSFYLAAVELSGNIPVCGPVKGCETVATSEYSRVLGIPVALPGLGMSLLILAAVVAWWRTGDHRILYVPYGVGILGVFAVGYLTYLELFVIHAVCVWCVTFAVAVVLGWIASIIALRRPGNTAGGSGDGPG
jgi:uncharacterized membrane protein